MTYTKQRKERMWRFSGSFLHCYKHSLDEGRNMMNCRLFEDWRLCACRNIKLSTRVSIFKYISLYSSTFTFRYRRSKFRDYQAASTVRRGRGITTRHNEHSRMCENPYILKTCIYGIVFAVDHALEKCTGRLTYRRIHILQPCLVREFAAHRLLATDCKNPFFSRRKERGIEKPYPPGHACVCTRVCTSSAHHGIQTCTCTERGSCRARAGDETTISIISPARVATCSTSATSPSVLQISQHDNRELTDKQGITRP